jgi:hypothetical protein
LEILLPVFAQIFVWLNRQHPRLLPKTIPLACANQPDSNFVPKALLELLQEGFQLQSSRRFTMDIALLSHLCSDASAQKRLALGLELLKIKRQRSYRSLGFADFDSFLNSDLFSLGHTVLRQALRLAQRPDLHSYLHLGIARLVELMRLSPEHSRLFLATSFEDLDVRELRLQILAFTPHQRPAKPRRAKPPLPALAKPVAHLPMVKPFLPETHISIPARWYALTEHLEQLALTLDNAPTSFEQLIQALEKPLSDCERAVFYLDRKLRKSSGLLVAKAFSKILTGQDREFNAQQVELTKLLAEAAPLSRRTIGFWKHLFAQVYPPEQYADFLLHRPSRVRSQEWVIDCTSPYQAEYLHLCLQDPNARVFWQIAAAFLDCSVLCLSWLESRQIHEQRIFLTPDLKTAC